ncbi:hypothetical protein E7681_14250 [Thalassobius vesicularis]|uniref:Apple domain-containing protein n=1 Tax=Thalassobius vesicularis TaxID=1294297 RepID=A0A4S3M6A6_9RHOB|nr:PAN domain-containing protein [Thalassobius vesicularis]THD72586.1 hypothetical protein E7681_14250 [Thalassobius vesicularis]
MEFFMMRLRGVFVVAIAMLTLSASVGLADCRPDFDGKPPSNGVLFFDSNDCNPNNGMVTFTLEDNNGNRPRLSDTGWKDRISSIAVGDGVKLTVYWSDNYEGRKATLWPGTYSRIARWDNDIASMKLEKFDKAKEGIVSIYLRDNITENTPAHHVSAGKFNFNAGGDKAWDLFVTGNVVDKDVWPKVIRMDKNMKITMYSDPAYTPDESTAHVETSLEEGRDIILDNIGWGSKLRSLKVERIEPDISKLEEGYKVVNVTGHWERVNPKGCSGCSNLSFAITVGSEHAEEIGNEEGVENEINASVTASVETTVGGPGAEATVGLAVSAGYSNGWTKSETIVKSFTTSEQTEVTEECDLGSMWQWRSAAVRECPNKAAACSPFESKGHTVCAPEDAEPPTTGNFKLDSSWGGCEKVATGVEFEGAGPAVAGVMIMLSPEYRCKWNYFMRYNGPELRTLTLTKNPEDCRAICSNTADCRAWSLNLSNGQCTMHQFIGEAVPGQTDFIAGTIASPKTFE